MKLREILLEVPIMVPQKAYPFEAQSRNMLRHATENISSMKKEAQDGGVRIMIDPHKPNRIFAVMNDEAFAMMELTQARATNLDVPSWQVWNVFMLPEHRNNRYGIMLYNFVLHNRKEAFASGAAMTPSSRRVYTSLFKDPTVDVYALVQGERQELSIGSDGVTTGDSEDDRNALFIAIAK